MCIPVGAVTFVVILAFVIAWAAGFTVGRSWDKEEEE